MKQEPGFTRIELAVLVTVVAVLAITALPMLATTRGSSHRAGCFNNLRQIGRAAQLWVAEHSERVPWWTLRNEGGTMFQGKAGSAWFEWAALTNELRRPIILACPADSSARVATTFDSSPNGFFNSGMRAQAVSYVVGLHALIEYPNTVLATDRNLRFGGRASCSTGINNADTLYFPFSIAAWTNAVHGALGNVTLIDGRVETTSSTRLGELIASEVYSGTHHFLRAR